MSSCRDNSLTCRIDNMLSSQPTSDSIIKPRIFKVHQRLRRVNETAYEPQMVAIGPIHRGKDHLKDMEQHKAMYLHQLLQRTGEHSVERYVVELMNMEDEARKCYSNSIELPKGDEFVEMLLLDGVFVIEYLRKRWFADMRDENDYIFQSTPSRYALRTDLVLMENQLPFFVLSQLFGMTKLDHPQDDLHYLLLRKIELETGMPFKQDIEYTHRHTAVHVVDDHLLGLVYETYISRKRTKSNNTSCLELENTASELEEAGVEFRTTKETNLMDVSFKDGVLQLPKLHAEDNTEMMLSNLVAYEQMNSKNLHTYMSDYIFLMSSLVKSTKDVGILRLSGVIENMLEDDEAIHLMISKLNKNITVGYFYSDIFQSLNDHCHRRRNKWMANLRRNYFNTPWATMSVIAAIILLLLTAIQTLFTILP